MIELIDVFTKLSVAVQLALIIGSVTIILLIGCSRQAAENLAFFFRELRSVLRPGTGQTSRRRGK